MSQKKISLIIVYLVLPILNRVSISTKDMDGGIVLDRLAIYAKEISRQFEGKMIKLVKLLDFCNKNTSLENHQKEELWIQIQSEENQFETYLKLNQFFFDCKNEIDKNSEINFEDESYLTDLDLNLKRVNRGARYVKDCLIIANRMIKAFIGNLELDDFLKIENDIILRKVWNFKQEGMGCFGKDRMEFYLGESSALKIVKDIIIDIFKNFTDNQNFLQSVVDLTVEEEKKPDFVIELLTKNLTKQDYMFFFLIPAVKSYLPKDNNLEGNFENQKNYLQERFENLLSPKKNLEIVNSKYFSVFLNNIKQGYQNPIEISNKNYENTSNLYNIFFMTTWEDQRHLYNYTNKTINRFAKKELDEIFVARRPMDAVEFSLHTEITEGPIRKDKKQFIFHYISNCRVFNYKGDRII